MIITNVKVVKNENGRLRGIAEVTLNNCFVIHNIRIIEGDKGLFIAFPSRQNSAGQYNDVCHPINQETRSMFETAIVRAYQEVASV
jgi:stage V sporulation protein G